MLFPCMLEFPAVLLNLLGKGHIPREPRCQDGKEERLPSSEEMQRAEAEPS